MSLKLLCAPILALVLVLTLAVAVTPHLSAQDQAAGPIAAVELAPGAEFSPHSHLGTRVLTSSEPLLMPAEEMATMAEASTPEP